MILPGLGVFLPPSGFTRYVDYLGPAGSHADDSTVFSIPVGTVQFCRFDLLGHGRFGANGQACGGTGRATVIRAVTAGDVHHVVWGGTAGANSATLRVGSSIGAGSIIAQAFYGSNTTGAGGGASFYEQGGTLRSAPYLSVLGSAYSGGAGAPSAGGGGGAAGTLGNGGAAVGSTGGTAGPGEPGAGPGANWSGTGSWDYGGGGAEAGSANQIGGRARLRIWY